MEDFFKWHETDGKMWRKLRLPVGPRTAIIYHGRWGAVVKIAKGRGKVTSKRRFSNLKQAMAAVDKMEDKANGI